ncbi:hypothetical protein [Nonomuraea cavernae]|uniref:Uncharacterized protein n=1 Tax=Nonomuraea cavernae TaxID=2045107 RepID=A0A918DP09_9ACTN|nr:hypothetical protein [Nonomuraea cavernae]GGO77798.1 hypothetical protein GCM10012289_58300 [Nonomuraea cavernae]
MPKPLIEQLATLFGAYDDLHLGDDTHALDPDEDVDEPADLDDDL